MSKNPNILFQRGGDQEGDSDTWDDTALIKAYDAAVSSMKTKLAAQHPDFAQAINSSSSKKKKSRQKAKKKKTSVNKSSHGWKEGDACCAHFTEDGVLYAAEIVALDEDGETCRVRYRDYGNEEDQLLEALLPASAEGCSSQGHQTDTASEIESTSDTPKPSTRRKQTRGPASQTGKKFSRSSGPPPTCWNGYTVPQVPPSSCWNDFAVPPVPPMASRQHFPPFPLQGSSFPSTTRGPQPPLHPSMFPGIPPPPPLFPCQDGEKENEALYSMLISWYMSGYHTGYYQGLKSSSHLHTDGPQR